MQYLQALEFLLNQLPMYQRIGPAAYRGSLDNIIRFCDLLGNPQNDLKCIHIAGTNGKGSVTHIIASALIEAGYKTGIYTSPHYLNYRERIKIGRDWIDESFVVEFISKHMTAIKSMNASFFEITTAMMFSWFKHQNTDWCVIETGLGGRLDSTNIIRPAISVITNISYDHQHILGKELSEIATQKAGIIKSKVPVIVGERQLEVAHVFVEKAKVLDAPLWFSDEWVEVLEFNDLCVSFVLKETGQHYTCSIDLLGNYQKQNIQTALAALMLLQKNTDIKITLNHIISSLNKVKKNTGFFGRWMVMSKKPLVIFDSAHNEGGIKMLLASLENLSFSNFHFVYGTVADKDLSMVMEVLPKNAIYYFCKPEVPRGKPANELANIASSFGLNGQAYASPAEALNIAISSAYEDDLVLAAGSIFLVADLLKCWEFEHQQP
ncbi:MAG: folylpolyglutamate synthase/dihydrofolate synthase family protein [Chitinophagales bacterium]|nr:folylpolyglutamate synthase/dihydrofolate synthase family protein [Chitinophagales bacterium]